MYWKVSNTFLILAKKILDFFSREFFSLNHIGKSQIRYILAQKILEFFLMNFSHFKNRNEKSQIHFLWQK